MSDGYPVGMICDALVYRMTGDEYFLWKRIAVKIQSEAYRDQLAPFDDNGENADTTFSVYGQQVELLEAVGPLPVGTRSVARLSDLRPPGV